MSTKFLKLERDLGWQGWREGESQGAAGSKRAMGPRTVLASTPFRAALVLIVAV